PGEYGGESSDRCRVVSGRLPSTCRAADRVAIPFVGRRARRTTRSRSHGRARLRRSGNRSGHSARHAATGGQAVLSTAAAPRAADPRVAFWQVPRSETREKANRNVRAYDLKLTFGACLASGGASKNGCSLKPKSFAVRFAGNCRVEVLYSWT